MNTEMLLGEILVEKGYISIAEMELGLARHRSSRKRLGETLIDMHLITQDQLNDALAAKFEIPVVELTSDMLSDELWNIVPLSFIREYQIIPILNDGSTLHVVTADPSNLSFKESLEKLTGFSISVSLSDEAVIKRLIQSRLGTEVDNIHEPIPDPGSLILDLIDVGAVQLMAAADAKKSHVMFKRNCAWEETDIPADYFMNAMKGHCNLSLDYSGLCRQDFQVGDKLIPARLSFIRNADSEYLTIRFGRELRRDRPFKHPLQDELYRQIIEGVWIVFSGFDPGIVRIAADVINSASMDTKAWISITTPGNPVSDSMHRFLISGRDVNEWRSSVIQAALLNPDGLFIQCPLTIDHTVISTLRYLRSLPCKCLLITESNGPYISPELSALQPMTLTVVTRLRKLCNTCKRVFVSHDRLTGFPESFRNRAREPVGCRTCSSGVMGTLSFVEVMQLQKKGLIVDGYGAYPESGSSWDLFPSFTTPARCLENIDSIHPDDLDMVYSGWRIMNQVKE